MPDNLNPKKVPPPPLPPSGIKPPLKAPGAPSGVKVPPLPNKGFPGSRPPMMPGSRGPDYSSGPISGAPGEIEERMRRMEDQSRELEDSKKKLEQNLPAMRTFVICLFVACVLPCTAVIAAITGCFWSWNHREELRAMPAIYGVLCRLGIAVGFLQTVAAIIAASLYSILHR